MPSYSYRAWRQGVGEGNAPNGRPLGTLVAWLTDGETLPDRIQHRNAFCIASLGIGKRKAGRDPVRDHPEGEQFFRAERKQRIGEEEEPSSVPMGYSKFVYSRPTAQLQMTQTKQHNSLSAAKHKCIWCIWS